MWIVYDCDGFYVCECETEDEAAEIALEEGGGYEYDGDDWF